MPCVSSTLPRVITTVPVRMANGTITWKTHGGQYLFIVLELVSGKEEWLGGKSQGFPTDAKLSRLSPVPFRLHMQMRVYMWVHSHVHPCAHAFTFSGSFTPGSSQRMVQLTGKWDRVLGLMWEHCHIQRVHFNGFVQKYVTPKSTSLLAWSAAHLQGEYLVGVNLPYLWWMRQLYIKAANKMFYFFLLGLLPEAIHGIRETANFCCHRSVQL